MSTSRTDSSRKGTTVEVPVVREQLLQPGDKVGHCRVIELIAAGGMANVYKVWHEQLEVVRAIKILKPGFSEEARGRLETEAKISANLRHTNIVEIYGMGYWNSIPYIEMEYINGPSLKEILEQNGRLPIAFALAVTHSLCNALQFAHGQDMTLYGKVYDGLIHRDIKPANILITSRGVVKLADFGIARPSEVSLHTVGSKVMGTFAYLSPEQLNGEKLDQRSDVYAVGAVLYEMITGSKAFPQKLLAELVQKKSKGQYIPMEALGVRSPKNLFSAVERSLALERNKRYPDAGEFDEELMAVLRKLTSKSPEDIARQYMKNPHGNAVSRKVGNSLQFSTTGLITILSLLFVGSTGFYLLDRFGIPQIQFSRKTVPVKQEQAPDTVRQLPIPASPPKASTPARKTESPAKVTPFEKGQRAFRSGNLEQASEIYESISAESLDSEQKKIRTEQLFEIYYTLKRYEKALALAESEHLNDARYFLLKGESYLKSGRLEDALVMVQKARSAPSASDNLLKKISYLQARVTESLFYQKPNRDNRQTSLKAWTSLKETFCSDQDISSECIEAQKKTEALSN